MSPQLIGQIMQGLETEIIYSFVIIVCSLMIYFGTKEAYKLTSHKGIKFFRKAFLFFAIAYFFRSFIKFILVYFNVGRIFEIISMFFTPLTLLLFMYFSSMAIFYLVYSVLWKKIKEYSLNINLFHILAGIIALVSIFFRYSIVYFIINIFLLFLVVLTVCIAYKNSKKKHLNTYIIYLLLSVFWILNIIEILVPKFLSSFHLFIYLISSGIFLLISYKVLKKIGS